MRFERLAAVWALASLTLLGCSAHPKEPPPSTDIDDTAYANMVRVLASDDFAGRKPGTPGEDKTVSYLVEQFRKLGLKPGNAASYVQQVPLLQILPDSVSMSVTGQTAVRELKIGKDAVVWSDQTAAQVQLSGSEMVFVGFGIVAAEYSWNDYADVDVRGKTVVVLAGDPGFASKDPTLFRGNSMTEYGRWDYKFEEAARQGALGVLIVHDAAALGFGWNVVQSTWSASRFVPAGERVQERLAVEGWIQNDAAHALFAAAGVDFARTATAAAYRGFKAVPLAMRLDATVHHTLRSFNSQNVIALWAGRRKSHEYVMYDAHWDSLGAAQPEGQHGIFNGAVDNATGVAGLVALAQSFVHTDPKPDRSIIFLATTAAESDLLGSAYYAQNPIFPLRQTAAVIVVDTLLPGGRTRDVSISGFGNTDLEESTRAEALLQGRETHADPNPQWGVYYRTDGYSFAHRGVPVLNAHGGSDVASRGPAWGKMQIEDYFAHRYRQTSDQYSADWDLSGAVGDLTLYYQVGLRLANARRFPRWYPNSEFRTSHAHAEPAGAAGTGGNPGSNPASSPQTGY